MVPREGTLAAVVTLLLLLCRDGASSGNEIQRPVRRSPNTVAAVSSSCSADTMTVRVAMARPFRGLLYSRGFPLECRALGTGQKEAKIQLPAAGCGVRVEPAQDGGLTFMVTVEVQLDRYLQQASDQQQSITCHLPAEKMLVESPALALAATNKTGHREGRMHGGKSTAGLPRQTAAQLAHVMAWMEIAGSANLRYPGQVAVGERTTLLIKSHVPDGVGSRVTDCLAHDGVGDISQRLLDDEGCPIDELILPALRDVSHNEVANKKRPMGTTLRVAGATFSAFKFPDRGSLHIRCTLQLCRGNCVQVDCSVADREHMNSTRSKRKPKGQPGEVLQTLDVFNSVEVLAPGIELDRPDQTSPDDFRDYPSGQQFPGLQGDRTFCLSPPKMALAFGVLGLIFLCAVAVALYTLLRSRRQPRYRGKLLLSEETLMVQDSPFLGMSSRQQWPYVRVIH